MNRVPHIDKMKTTNQHVVSAPSQRQGRLWKGKAQCAYTGWLYVMALCSGCCSVPTGKMVAGTAIICSPTDPWIVTNFAISENKTYRIAARAIEDDQGRAYSDKGVKATPDGSRGLMGTLMNRYARRGPYRFWNPARRQTDIFPALRVQMDRNGKKADFMSLMTIVVGADESREKAESQLASRVLFVGHGTSFKSDRDGRLVFFVNDWPGDENNDRYGNNTGLLIIQVSEVLDDLGSGGEVLLKHEKTLQEAEFSMKSTCAAEELP